MAIFEQAIHKLDLSAEYPVAVFQRQYISEWEESVYEKLYSFGPQ